MIKNINKQIILRSSVIAFKIPDGSEICLSIGTKVTLIKYMNGSSVVIYKEIFYFILCYHSYALGEKYFFVNNKCNNKKIINIKYFDKHIIWNQLKQIYDPEIPVNIVDLGLIYSIDIVNCLDNNMFDVNITMTLTSPVCGMSGVLIKEIKYRLNIINCIKNINIDIVFDPIWNFDMMSEEGKLMLGLL